MIRIATLFGAGLLCLVLVGSVALSPGAGPADTPATPPTETAQDVQLLPLEDGEAPLLQLIAQKGTKKHYSVDKRLRGLKDGAYRVGQTVAGRPLDIQIRKNGVSKMWLERLSVKEKVA